MQEQTSCVCKPETCDTFQFMSKKLGMQVLHPGGLKATKHLAEICKVSSSITILDAGCGSGSNSIFLAKQYGCRVIGVDIDPTSLMKAHEKARRKNILDLVAFRLADLNSLALGNIKFEGVVFQASLIFCDKARVLNTTSSMIRPGGFLGAVELTWKKPPPAEILTRVKSVLCAATINAELEGDWIKILERSGLEIESSEIHDLNFGFHFMLENEGLFSTIRIMYKCAFNQEARNKTQAITNLFKETSEYLGFGIYVCRKPIV
jgi:arsenite methyltransferase